MIQEQHRPGSWSLKSGMALLGAALLLASQTGPALWAQAPITPPPAITIVPETPVTPLAPPAAANSTPGAVVGPTVTVPTAPVSTSLSAMPAVNVLIIAFDEIDGKAPVQSGAISSGASVGTGQGLSATPPGLAQAGASALRRALVRAGWSDVLTTAPDSAVIRRALSEGRITPASLDLLRTSLRQLAALSLQDSATPTTAVSSEPLPSAASPLSPSPLTPVPAAGDAKTAVTQALTQNASRIGQALGYRAVLALAVIPQNATPPGVRREATYVMYLADALREVGQPLSFDEGGADATQMHETAAVAASAFANKELQLWSAVSDSERAQKIQSYLQQARAALDANKTEEARAAAQRALALDSTLVEAHLLLGDATKKSDPTAAAAAYRLALGKNAAGDGEVWAKIASAQAGARNWPGALEAARRALELRHDSAALRQAMAMAQFGRAQLFREAGRMDSADSAEAEARDHIDRARALSPDDPATTRVLASYLVSQRDFRAALQSLDALAPRYLDDLEVQTLYATALTERGGRDAEAFAAWARVWQMDDSAMAPLSARYYRRIAEGFDEYVSELAKDAARLTSGVSAGTVPREEALLSVQRMNRDMQRAEAAIKMMQPASRSADAAHARRIFAADLLGQAIDQQRVFVETGDEIYRGRAADLHRQAVIQLNSARTGA